MRFGHRRIWVLINLCLWAGCASSRGVAPAAPPAAPVEVIKEKPAAKVLSPAGEMQRWKRELLDPVTRQAALEALCSLELAEVRPLVPMLTELARAKPWQEGDNAFPIELRDPALRAIARLKDPGTIPLFLELLQFYEMAYEPAVTAAQFLGEMKVAEAVEPLMRAMESPLPLKSPANKVRLAAIAALVAIADARAVPALMRGD